MSLFDLQDVCIAIGSLATLDLPMVVDLIGIYVLKVPYCMLTTTNWFLQALSVIPRGSWQDVSRRFTMIRWASPKSLIGVRLNPVVDLIGGSTAAYSLKCRFPRETGRSQAPRRQQGKWVYLVTHVMSLFDLQDVCMVIESLTTLDLSMIIDSIGIYELKGSYCTLTMTDWFLQAHSVIPRGSWGDVARRFIMIRLRPWDIHLKRTKSSSAILSLPLLSSPRRRRLAVAARRRRRRTCSIRSGEEIPSVKSSSCFQVQTDKGIGIPVMDRIRRPTQPTVEVPISS
ncbi:hypothetical protein F511_11287 [Dorcoceras hygrometricum]|uniref:Uncharacterized protein n=1 Tax=Dorcoceras hygrometricum TaxID=472368 RepID=A0A2Z7B8D1_9LAMI|nr:hypothetical protein F511_11287 [Dorcoceras hygrometricum]